MKNFFAIVFISLLGICLYGATLHGVPGNLDAAKIRTMEFSGTPFESSHERAPYAQLLAIVQNHSFDLTRELADMGAPDVGYEKGKFYSFFPVGITALILPLYLVGVKYGLAQLFAYSTIALFAVFNLILIFLITRKVFKTPIWGALLAIMVYGFASTSWGYSITIYQHAISTFFLLLCIYGAWKVKEGSSNNFIWAAITWGSYALSFFIDYPNALIISPVIVYFFLSGFVVKDGVKAYKISYKWSIILASSVFIAITALHGYYNLKVYGGATKLSNVFARYERDKFDLLLKRVNEQENIGLGRDKLKLTSTFQESAMPRGLVTLIGADDKGILFFSPIFLLAVLGFAKFFRSKKYEGWVLFFVFVINLSLYASFGDPWGGWAYGPRYLIPSMAMLSIATAVAVVSHYRSIWLRVVTLVLFVYSSAIALLGALTTNIVPPKIESIPLHLPYHNYLLNYHFLIDGGSASYFYKYILHKGVSTIEYFWIIFCTILVVFLVIMFILPRYEKADDSLDISKDS